MPRSITRRAASTQCYPSPCAWLCVFPSSACSPELTPARLSRAQRQQAYNRVYTAKWVIPRAQLGGAGQAVAAATPARRTPKTKSGSPDSDDSLDSSGSTISANKPTTTGLLPAPGALSQQFYKGAGTRVCNAGGGAGGGAGAAIADDAPSLRAVAVKVAPSYGREEAAIHRDVALDKRTARYVVPLLYDQALPSRGDSTWLLVTPLMPHIGLADAAVINCESDAASILLALMEYTVQLLEVRRPAHTPLPVCNLLSLTPPLVCMFV